MAKKTNIENVMENYKEFINRTLSALEQYDKYIKEHPKEQSYSRTLFINACVALLMIPRDEIFKSLPKTSVEEWGIDEDKISMEGSNDKKIPTTVFHLRNSIAHNRFEYNCNEVSIPVEEIIFTDKKKNIKNFEARLDYKSFKKFVLNVTDFALKVEGRPVT